MTKTYTATVQHDPETDECFILLPDELSKEINWEVGDELNYEDVEGKIIISNVTKNKDVP